MKTSNIKSVAAAITVFIVSGQAANATVLRGGVKVNDGLPEQSNNTFALSAEQKVAQQKEAVEGTWNCISKVVASTCPAVMPGTVVHSLIQYLKNTQGSLVQQWNEAGWMPASTPVLKFTESSITTTKTSNMQGIGGGWTARSQEHLKLLDPNTMIAESVVEQYLNGQFVGRYKTSSVLKKNG